MNFTTFTILMVLGEEEKLYWQKIITDKERKFNTKSKGKKRGANRVRDHV